MKKKNLLLLMGLVAFHIYSTDKIYPWAVVGAGPAGIISVAVLLEHGVHEQDIIWIDPEFKVGRMGKYYGHVPANHQAHQFTTFLESHPAFQKVNSPSMHAVFNYDQNKEPYLQLVVDPLQDITDYLRTKIACVFDKVLAINQHEQDWTLLLSDKKIIAHKVVLAHGSHPKRFSYNEPPQELSLDLALDENKIKTMVTADDTVMVVGSASSALLVVKYLAEFPVKKVINIYTKAPVYGPYRGIGGITATWAQEVLEKNPPENVERIRFEDGIIEKYLPECTKIVYAFGYQRNSMLINGSTDVSFDQETGIIQPGLFGIGIAFAREYMSASGDIMRLVGLNAFTKYAKELIPAWLKQ
ncbi:MAG: FAD/NAD(P)-binding protein [Candidatus Dependentiae bacterium]|nr:FAD/NAD(P)-binding protein [Candidatus Dependentiae bacterium]